MIEVIPGDEETVKRLFMQYLKDTYPTKGNIPPLLENVDTMWRYVFAPSRASGVPQFIALKDGMIAGAYFSALEPSLLQGMKPQVSEHGIFVLPEYRGTRVLHTLLKHVYSFAAALGIPRIVGAVLDTNPASKLVLRGGGVRIGSIYEVDLEKGNIYG